MYDTSSETTCGGPQTDTKVHRCDWPDLITSNEKKKKKKNVLSQLSFFPRVTGVFRKLMLFARVFFHDNDAQCEMCFL